MIKEYTLEDGTIFKTITIPKGTILFRGMYFSEGESDMKLFSDLWGYKEKYGEDRKISPNMNVFFYPAPYVSQCADMFNVHILYVTQYDLELLLMISPSEHYRGLRKNILSPIRSIMMSCDDIAKIDKCGIDMKNADPCFTEYFIKTYSHILGYIAIAKTDSSKFHMMYKNMFRKGQYTQLEHILSCISQNSEGQLGIPEIVLHPLHLRTNECEIIREHLATSEYAVDYFQKIRARFNYFPLLYCTRSGVYSFSDLAKYDILQSIKETESSEYINDPVFFKILEKLLLELLSPEGKLISNRKYTLTIDTRTGFYRIPSYQISHKRKTYRNKNGRLRLVNIERHDEYTVPISYSAKDKMRVIKYIGTQDAFFLEYLQKSLNRNGLALRNSYVLSKGNKGHYINKFHIDSFVNKSATGGFLRKTRRHVNRV
jgi:hypothetical protein